MDGNGLYDPDSFMQQRSSLPWRNPPQIVPKDRKGQPVACVQGMGSSRPGSSSSSTSPGTVALSNALGSLTMNASTTMSSRGSHNYHNQHSNNHTSRHHQSSSSSSPAVSSGGGLGSKGQRQRITPGRPISPSSSRAHPLTGVQHHNVSSSSSHYHHPYHQSPPPSSSPRRQQQVIVLTCVHLFHINTL